MSVPPAVPYISWPAVQAVVGSDIPYAEVPTDARVYFNEVQSLMGYKSHPGTQIATMGVIRFIERHRSRQKEAEFKTSIERMASQQQESNEKYDKLAKQYEQLLAAYNSMKQAYETETETTRALKAQLDEILGMIKGT